MNRDTHFWNKTAERYAKHPIADMAAYEHKLAKTREYFTPEARVLELGCGTGSTALLHAPYVQQYHATDVSAKMIEIASRKLREQPIDNLSFEMAAINEVSIAEPLDIVLALNLLHLLKDRDEAIQQIYQWLKPGGLFISNTVCLGNTMKFFKYINPIGRLLGLMPQVSVFSADQLVESVTTNGFKIEYQWQPKTAKFFSVFIIARKQ